MISCTIHFSVSCTGFTPAVNVRAEAEEEEEDEEKRTDENGGSDADTNLPTVLVLPTLNQETI